MNWIDFLAGTFTGVVVMVGTATAGALHIKKHPELIVQMMFNRSKKKAAKTRSTHTETVSKS